MASKQSVAVLDSGVMSGESSEKSSAIALDLQQLLDTRFLDVQRMLSEEHKRTMQMVANYAKKDQASSSGADKGIAQEALQRASPAGQTGTQPVPEEVATPKEQKVESCLVPAPAPKPDVDDDSAPREVGDRKERFKLAKDQQPSSIQMDPNKIKHTALIVVLFVAWWIMLLSV